jgi:hypothetical protein
MGFPVHASTGLFTFLPFGTLTGAILLVNRNGCQEAEARDHVYAGLKPAPPEQRKVELARMPVGAEV